MNWPANASCVVRRHSRAATCLAPPRRLAAGAGSLAAGAATQRSGRAPPPVRGANRRQRQQTVCKNRIVIIAIQEPILGEPPPAQSRGAAGRPRAAGTGRQRLAAAGTVKRRRSGQTPTQSTGAGRRNGQTPKKWSNTEEVVKRRHSRQGLAAVAAARRALAALTRHG